MFGVNNFLFIENPLKKTWQFSNFFSCKQSTLLNSLLHAHIERAIQLFGLRYVSQSRNNGLISAAFETSAYFKAVEALFGSNLFKGVCWTLGEVSIFVCGVELGDAGEAETAFAGKTRYAVSDFGDVLANMANLHRR